MIRSVSLYSLGFLACLVFLAAPQLLAVGPSEAQSRVMMGALMRMELGGQVVAEAQKMSNLKEVAEAAGRQRERFMDAARERLLATFPSAAEAQPAFAAFVDAVNANPAEFAALRGEVA